MRTALFPSFRRHRLALAASVLAMTVGPVSAPTSAARDAEPERERDARDPCARLLDVPGQAKGLHRRCGALGGGSGVARGDFNGDGVGDLAVGIPDENVGSVVDAGAVQIIYGSSANGLTSTGTQVVTQSTAGVAGVPEDNDHFGLALAAINIDGDAFSDLAIGVPDEDTAGFVDEGFVQIMRGSASGLVAAQFYDFNSMEGGRCGCRFGASLAWGDFNDDGLGDLAMGMPTYDVTYVEDRIFYEKRQTVHDVGAVIVQFGDAPGAHVMLHGYEDYRGDDIPGGQFGLTLAAGDHDGDGFDDLAVGQPFFDGSILAYDYGRVWIYAGASSGLRDDGEYIVHFRHYRQGDAGGTSESGDQFGRSLAFGDFDGDGRDDLVVGTPYEDLDSHNDAGAIFIFYGDQLRTPNRYFTQDGLSGERAEATDLFGFAVAAGDFDGDGTDDLAIGVPNEDIGNPYFLPTYFQDAGLVHVLYGDLFYGLPGGGTEIWHQDTSGVPGANEAGDRFGYSLSAWNFGRSAHRDLAIGVPYDDIDGFTDAGQVTVLYGSNFGLSTAGAQSWHQGILGGLESYDRFGKSMY